MHKFGRNYRVDISTSDSGPTNLTIKLPYSMEFDITRNTLSSANVCQIRLYNLSEENRNKIRKDQSDYANYRAVTLMGGYGDNLATIFSGTVSAAWSVREGTNFITQIECYDGGFAYVNGETNYVAPAGTPLKSIIASLAATLPGVTIGKIGDYPGKISRATPYNGNTMYLLKELTGGGAFIDNTKFYALGTNEYVSELSSVGIITSNSGLLNTPLLQNRIIHLDMIFEPGMQVGQLVKLDSSTLAADFNGFYKVTSVKHRGIISPVVAGTAITSVQFFNKKEAVPAL